MIAWPPQSPDLSLIEMLWPIIKRKLRGRRFENEDDMLAAIEAAWDEIPKSVVDNLVGSFRARCQVCLKL
jgi:transposase